MVAVKVSSTLLYVTLTITLLVAAIFYLPSLFFPEAKMWLPVQTDILLYWMYTLFVLATTCTVLFAIRHLILLFRDDPRRAYTSLGMMLFSALILLVAWLLGSDDTSLFTAYTQQEDIRFWLKVTDMFLYTIYLMLSVTVLTILASYVLKLYRNR